MVSQAIETGLGPFPQLYSDSLGQTINLQATLETSRVALKLPFQLL